MRMKLSDAMRLGAMLGPQVQGRYFRGSGSCALGAAAVALGLPVSQFYSEPRRAILPNIYQHDWPSDMQWMFVTDPPPCPVCSDVRASVDAAIRHLNDIHRWTREQIADWVETIEAQQPVSPEAVPCEVAIMTVLNRTHLRGFGSMPKDQQKAIASLGGKAAHRNGTAHKWTSEEAKAAGKKGGTNSAAKRKAQTEA